MKNSKKFKKPLEKGKICAIILVIATVLFVALCWNIAKNRSLGTEEQVMKAFQREGAREIEIEVYRGDTLWDIGKSYWGESIDIRDFVYYVKIVNGLKSANAIKARDIIIIPVPTEKEENNYVAHCLSV